MPRGLLRQAPFLVGLCLSAWLAAASPAEEAAQTQTFAGHPAQASLEALFPNAPGAWNAQGFTPTGISQADYLKLIASNVDFFKKYQNGEGAILDPDAKAEIQYSTPSFAVAAGILIKEAARPDLLEPACKALTCSITELVTHHAAGQHADFYIPLIMHAYEELKTQAPPATRAAWEGRLRQIIPQMTYRMDLRGSNWNLVSSLGELLRRKAGLVPPEYQPSQWQYLEDSLTSHEKNITPFGLIEDTKAPPAFDEISRVWLEDVVAADACDGAFADPFRRAANAGALSGLLLLSPTGEWPNGGRSTLHNWNEAENTFICETQATHWKNAGRMDIAGAMKRAAHLAFESVRRWQRPSGELLILKNRADPVQRFGFETYSSQSQYDLFSVAMLALACRAADDAIPERPAPSETGGYVFDLRDPFHEIAAAAAGYYVLIDTSADPHYGATGLQRVHRAGVPFPALSDSVAIDRAYEPKDAPSAAITPGLCWRNTNAPDAPWHSLADFTGHQRALVIKSVDLRRGETTPQRVAFDVDYLLAGPGEDGRHLVQHYVITGAGVECTAQLIAPTPPVAFRAQFPALVSDGAAAAGVTLAGATLTIANQGSITAWAVLSPLAGDVQLLEPRVVNHNGWIQRAIVPLKTPELHDRITLSHGE